MKKKKVECKDNHCPFHGSLKLRGRTFSGLVNSAKMRRTATFEVKRKYYLKKYERSESRITKLKAHNPDCIGAVEGDAVKVMECRPISKTKRFVIIEKVS
jgi:small subunit ribosomal protein S17